MLIVKGAYVVKRRILSLFIICNLLWTLILPIYAYENENSETLINIENVEKTDTLINLLAEMSLSNTKCVNDKISGKRAVTYEILDKNGNDITVQFYTDNIQALKNNNYESIEEYIDLNVSQIRKMEEVPITNATNNSTTIAVSNIFYKTCNDVDPEYELKGLEVTYKLNGSYTYDNTFKIITSASKPSIEYFNTIDWNASLVPETNRRTYSEVDADGKRAVFSVTFDTDVRVYDPYQGLFNVLVDFGSWTSSFTRVADDTPIGR